MKQVCFLRDDYMKIALHFLNVQIGEFMNSLLRALETQRWDDHRYYHHSRINQPRIV